MAGAIIDSRSVHYNTPPWLIGVAEDVLGTIDLDPCSNGHSLVPARKRLCGSGPDDDGLAAIWGGQRVFVNPPYGRGIGLWLRKGAESQQHVLGADVLMLVPAAVETKAWKQWVWPHASRVCFLRGRVRFWLDGKQTDACITRPVALVLFSEKLGGIFDAVCSKLGEVVTPLAWRHKCVDAFLREQRVVA